MKVKTLSEIRSSKSIIPAGQIIEISWRAFIKIRAKVEVIETDQQLYCQPYGGHCSVKILDYPTGCSAIACEHLQGGHQ